MYVLYYHQNYCDRSERLYIIVNIFLFIYTNRYEY